MRIKEGIKECLRSLAEREIAVRQKLTAAEKRKREGRRRALGRFGHNR